MAEENNADNEKIRKQLLASFMENSVEMLEHERASDREFRERAYARWKPGLDLLKILLQISLEFGAQYNERNRPAAALCGDYLFEATVNLHARAVRISQEIYTLLCEGFPDGALSRWRTVHEIAVTSLFLKTHGKGIAERFILHREINDYKRAVRYQNFCVAANLAPITDEEMDAQKNEEII